MADASNEASEDEWEPRDPAWQEKVRSSFPRQTLLGTLGARLLTVRPGLVQIEMPFSDKLMQQHGFLHSGAYTSIADSAGGYACYSLMPPDSAILTIEFKVNLLAPGKGQRFVATGRVLKTGRKLFIAELEVVAFDGDKEHKILHGMQTNMRLPASENLPAG
ncbi:MAG: hypothetical protein ACI82F_000346 [Planctomycetota bacterium]|jgi:uncharacterized protein (TIGR00369 family)